ncbi:MAG: MFS transporter [Acidobacteriia bacterium]|nr:MFS transporter [Terriglobia bacterium]
MTRINIFRDYPRTFWIANVMELFERAAYYGLNSILGGYLTLAVAEGGLGFNTQAVGFLQGIVYAFTYVLPILGGALADRYGYRRVLLVAFSLLATGYFAAGNMSSYALVFLFLLVMATGSGLFKPIISGTIARTTDERTSGLGFGIYYWMINLGAFLAPLVVSVLKGFSWQYVFTASAAYCAAMLLPALFLYREPPRPVSTKKLGEVLAGAAEVLGDARFMLMVVVYSGFWILYFQNFGTVLWYLRDVIDKEPVSTAITGLLHGIGLPWSFQFDIEHVTAINAGTIILLQVLVSRIVSARKALPTMVTGMSIGAAGFLLLALSRNPWVFVAGIAVFSIGEMTAHPKYYSFIGLVAPQDRKAVYMGYAFLYGVFGSLLGANVGALLYARMIEPVLRTNAIGGRSTLFWLLFAVLDVCAALGLILFFRKFGSDTADTRRRAARAMNVAYGLIGLLGLAFLVLGVTAQPIQYRTVVQAVIFLTLGVGGLWINRHGATRAVQAAA